MVFFPRAINWRGHALSMGSQYQASVNMTEIAMHHASMNMSMHPRDDHRYTHEF